MAWAGQFGTLDEIEAVLQSRPGLSPWAFYLVDKEPLKHLWMLAREALAEGRQIPPRCGVVVASLMTLHPDWIDLLAPKRGRGRPAGSKTKKIIRQIVTTELAVLEATGPNAAKRKRGEGSAREQAAAKAGMGSRTLDRRIKESKDRQKNRD